MPERLSMSIQAALVALFVISSCGDSDLFGDRVYPVGMAPVPSDASMPDATGADAETPEEPARCVPALASDALRPRTDVMKQTQTSGAEGVFTRDLFGLFRSHCGACHVDQALGGLSVSLATFAARVDESVLARIRSDDITTVMPPPASGGRPYAERDERDPVVELATLLGAWLEAGSPPDVFYPEAAQGTGSGGFTIDERVGNALTNLGNCVPNRAFVVLDTPRARALDAQFEAMTELPERLDQTDLVSLDAAVLARDGVLAFAPTYNLWADDAKKLRLLRLPVGATLAFDEETQQFAVPANTRVYKTFLRRVIDYRGNVSYRKMETRLIVSRPDRDLADGTRVPGALFGTYVWNEAETEATLLRDPLRNGEPFRDRLFTYILDEQAADEVISRGPDDLQAALESSGLTRTYAVPGSNRCIHCHMGAPNGSFLLGVTPLQLRRRLAGEGGVTESSKAHELDQFERFLSYGLFSGIDSVDQVRKLETSQGDRLPRNEHELSAQAYMMGNCAHCHNPRGFPSTAAPELRDVLDFYPSAKGGIFQFPLDRVSPRIFRGERRDIAIPYISPSLYDRPRPGEVGHPDAKVIGRTPCSADNPAQCYSYLFAPWRSLIYRNVDTPFSYAEDSAIFPHMPMDTAGYDCRVRQIMGNWMLSIPTAFIFRGFTPPDRNGTLEEFSYYASGSSDPNEPTSDHPQPFVELREGDPNFGLAQIKAQVRLSNFAASERLRDCPAPALDIVDPSIVRGDAVVPAPQQRAVLNSQGEQVGVYALRVPERAHFADTDLTQAPGDWNPRRPDWPEALLTDAPRTDDPEERRALGLLRGLTITESFRKLALTEVPFGLWQERETCNFASQGRVADVTTPPRWMALRRDLDPNAHVYRIAPGAVVFNSICANCHGPLADSQGRLAATIADMTGGQTRVANLRDGLFGPVGRPGENLVRVFGVDAALDAEDLAARYALWMGLGGTERAIPPAALAVVGTTSVLGQARQGQVYELSNVKDANMLSVARVLCAQVLPKNALAFDLAQGAVNRQAGSALIASNGDAEMWEALCTHDNPLPVRVVEVINEAGSAFRSLDFTRGGLCLRADYPADALIGNEGGATHGISADNSTPWCIKQPTAEAIEGVRLTWKSAHGVESEPPFCPAGYLDSSHCWSDDDLSTWTTRGAMNAGLSVFLYLEALAKGETSRPVAYDRCEELRP